jgi:hypothetical protein
VTDLEYMCSDVTRRVLNILFKKNTGTLDAVATAFPGRPPAFCSTLTWPPVRRLGTSLGHHNGMSDANGKALSVALN